MLVMVDAASMKLLVLSFAARGDALAISEDLFDVLRLEQGNCVSKVNVRKAVPDDMQQRQAVDASEEQRQGRQRSRSR